MPRELVPIRVVILRKKDKLGQVVNDYPDFNKIAPEHRGELDWCHAIDHYGIGMHYSRDGFGQGSNPHSQICAACVPEAFATAAVSMFPERVSFMSEEEWQSFYDDDAHSEEPEQHHDVDILQSLAAKKTLGIELTESDRKALDPNHPMTGIVKNRTRFWKDAKAHHGVILKSLGSAGQAVISAPSPIDPLPSCC